MLKRYLFILLSIIVFSSAKADADGRKADGLDTSDILGVMISGGPDNPDKAAPREPGPSNLYKVPPRVLAPADTFTMAPRYSVHGLPAMKVTPRYVKPASSVGIIVTDRSHVKNRKNTWACTAFCAAEDIIATSAHCLAKAKGRDLPTLDGITFRLRSYISKSSKTIVLRGRLESSRLKSVDERNPHLAIYSGYAFKGKSVAKVSNDWAFAKLQHPICQGRSLPFRPMTDKELIAAGKNKKIFMIAYDKENIAEPNIATACKIFSRYDSHKFPSNLRRILRKNKAIVIHDCDSREGSSGGPIFVNMDDVPQVVAINQGAIVSEKRVPVKRVRRGNGFRIIYKSTKKKFKSATHPGALIEGFARFREEKLLNSLDEFKEVQTYLKDLRLYRGKIDGLLGPATKRALIRYEKRSGLVPIGIPTQRLLSLLRIEFKTDATDSTSAEQ